MSCQGDLRHAAGLPLGAFCWNFSCSRACHRGSSPTQHTPWGGVSIHKLHQDFACVSISWPFPAQSVCQRVCGSCPSNRSEQRNSSRGGQQVVARYPIPLDKGIALRNTMGNLVLATDGLRAGFRQHSQTVQRRPQIGRNTLPHIRQRQANRTQIGNLRGHAPCPCC